MPVLTCSDDPHPAELRRPPGKPRWCLVLLGAALATSMPTAWSQSASAMASASVSSLASTSTAAASRAADAQTAASRAPSETSTETLSADLKARSLAATCAACHGTNGRTTADDALPRLAGRPATEIAEALRAFRSGARPGTVMPQLAKGYDETQIDLLARYFAAQPVATERSRR